MNYKYLKIWSRRRESNPRPTVYETVALPTELRRLTARNAVTSPGVTAVNSPANIAACERNQNLPLEEV